MPEIHDRVRATLAAAADKTDAERVDMLVRLIGDEKSKSYGIGYQDGQRRIRHPYFAHQ